MRYLIAILLFFSLTVEAQYKVEPMVKSSVQSPLRVGYGVSNSAPYLSGLSITGSPYIDSTLTFNYTFNDAEGDLEDSTLVTWYNTNTGLVQYSGTTYTVTSADSGYYVFARGTPWALTGVKQGDSLSANAVGPVLRNDPELFAEGVIFIHDTDTTQVDSIYTDADSSNLLIESDGFLFTVAKGGVSYNAEYDTVLAAMTTDPTGDTLTWQNALVDSLVNRGYWARMDGLWIMATTDNSAGEADINWINPGTYDLVPTNAPTWTKLEGYTGNGSSSYLETNLNISTHTSNYTQNDATVGYYLRDDQTENVGEVGSSSGQFRFVSRWTDNTFTYYLNSASYHGPANADATGLILATRRGSTATEAYRDGASLGNGTPTSAALVDATVWFLRSTTTYSDHQISIVFLMDQISDAEAVVLTTLFETYMDAIGTGVDP